VNVSPLALDGDFVVSLHESIARHGLGPGDLVVEITESAAMSEAEHGAGILSRLAESDVAVAIDDFGTGHSSLSRLATLPVGTIKIDRSFVLALGRGGAADTLVASIVQLVLALGRTPLAEGIETEGQRAQLVGCGCLLGQGYLFGRPMPADELRRRLDEPVRAAAA
jgi:EAL domain-containing protein (putative c-di-GMP-specific phosphodiesterase class I)